MDAPYRLVRRAPDTYANGYESREKLGSLIPHPLLDKLLAKNPRQFIDPRVDEMLIRKPGALKTGQLIWTLELIVAPKPYDVFRRGIDIVDPMTGWTFPWSCVPETAFEVPGLSIQIIGKLSGRGEATMVRPKNPELMHVIQDFIQEPMGRGAVDPITRMATAREARAEGELRRLKRPPTEFIRSATRCAFDWNFISLAEHPDKERFWLVFLQHIAKSMMPESSEQNPPNSTSNRTPTRVDIQSDSGIESLMRELNEVLGR